MKITSEEIAKLANVSRSTVSRVINNYSNVPDETREKVMAVIEEYGYEPNSFARVLAGKAKQEIALYISDCNAVKKRWKGIESPYFMRLIAELVSQGKEYGYMISVFVVSQVTDFAKIENMYLNREICGGIFVGFEFQMEAVNQLITAGFNMVVIDPGPNMIQADNVSGIYSQNLEAGYMATRYLIEQGHKKIAHLCGDDRLSSRERVIGYKKAMTEAGLSEEILIEAGDFNSEKAGRAVQKLLKQPITAIYAANDLMAIIAMRMANDMNKRVPEDIMIMGCDYNATYEDLGYHLTTVEISVREIARTAVRAVIGMEKKKRLICKAKFIKGTTA
ncbi:MAG: LacI family DNA-binding transcriptional regulator [Clostridiaceae bacterium]|nr:LacI family DNA-binding transcriptional regulator [Clostridiaceae bacterium]